MSTRPNDEPAFPAAPNLNYTDDAERGQRGMSLRDYFAAKAMQGLLSDPNTELTSAEVARYAYINADAMLAERSKHKP